MPGSLRLISAIAASVLTAATLGLAGRAYAKCGDFAMDVCDSSGDFVKERSNTGAESSAVSSIPRAGELSGPTVEGMVAALQSQEAEVRLAPAKALGETKDPRAVKKHSMIKALMPCSISLHTGGVAGSIPASPTIQRTGVTRR